MEINIRHLSINCCKTSCVDLCKVLRMQRPHELNQLSPNLVTKLVRTKRIKNVREDQEELDEIRSEDARRATEEVEQRAQHRTVLGEVILRQQDADKHGQDLDQWDCHALLEDHVQDDTRGVFASVQLQVRGVSEVGASDGTSTSRRIAAS